MSYHRSRNGVGGHPHIPPGALAAGTLPPPNCGGAAFPFFDTRPSSSLFTGPPINIGGFVRFILHLFVIYLCDSVAVTTANAKACQ